MININLAKPAFSGRLWTYSYEALLFKICIYETTLRVTRAVIDHLGGLKKSTILATETFDLFGKTLTKLEEEKRSRFPE